MFEEIKSIKSGKKELRQFGLSVGIVLGVLGALFVLRQKGYCLYFLIVSLAFLFLGSVLPLLLKPIQKVWMTLATFIGWLVTRVILIVLFYLVVTPIGILAKMFGKCFLDTEFNRNAESYWMAKDPVNFDKRSYEHQF